MLDPVSLAMLVLALGGGGIYVMWLLQERKWARDAERYERERSHPAE